jgi:hypothetical protein
VVRHLRLLCANSTKACFFCVMFRVCAFVRMYTYALLNGGTDKAAAVYVQHWHRPEFPVIYGVYTQIGERMPKHSTP